MIKEMVREWNYSAENIWEHFRGVLRGFLPFAAAEKNNEDVKARSQLDDMSVQYMRRVPRLLKTCSQ